MTSGSDELHVLLGAYLLGGLSDADHRAFTEHLRTCADCQSELGQLSGLPRLLELARPVGGPHLSPDAALELGASGDERRTRRGAARPGRPSTAHPAPLARRRGGGGGRGGLRCRHCGSDRGSRLPRPCRRLTSWPLPEPGSGSPVRVDVALVTRGWGTQLDLACEDMPTDGELLLYVIDRQGTATPAASWRATPAGYSRLTGATALRPDEIQRLEIRDGDGRGAGLRDDVITRCVDGVSTDVGRADERASRSAPWSDLDARCTPLDTVGEVVRGGPRAPHRSPDEQCAERPS